MPIRPLLFMRKRSLLGTFMGKHYGFNRLSKSVGNHIELGGGTPVPADALLDTSTAQPLTDSTSALILTET